MARLFDDGSSEYLEIDQAPVSGEPFTMACWFYSDDDTADQTLMSVGDKDSANVFHSLRIMGGTVGDPIQAFSSIFGSYEKATTSSGFTANTWHHGCGVFAASDDRRVYIDGGNKGTDSNDINVAGLDRTAIGRTADSTPALYFSGRIAEAAAWNVALTDAEAALLAAKYSPLFIQPANLVAYWALTANDDDWLGSYDLTAFNAPSWAAHPSGIMYPVQQPAIYNGVTLY